MNDIKKIVLFKDETSKDGGSWLIIRDSDYEIVSLKEGKRICAEYAAMNGITTRKMVNEQLLNKVVFYSSDFNSALRDYVAENVFYVNSNNTDVKNVHAENNDIVSGMTDNLSNDGDYMLAEDAEEVVETLEEKPNQFVMVGKPYTPIEISDGVNSSESLETSDSQLFSEAKDDLINKPIVEEKKPNQFVMVGNPYVSDDADDGVIESEEIGEEPISIGEEVGEEPPREDEHEVEPPREDEHEVEPPREDEYEEEPPREDEHEEEPPREDEHEEEPSSEDEHEEEPPREDEHEEELPREDEHEEESPREDEHEEESIGDEDITIIDRIKSFGNNALKKLKELTFFGTIFGMVLAGIVTIFGVKYSLNRDKDDIYVNHHSNTEEFADDEDLYTSPLAKFINKIFPTNEYNESEEILMGDDTDLEIDDNIDDNSNSPIQYIPYSSESEIYDNYDADETDFVEATADTDIDENDFVEITGDTDIDETDFVETTTDTDIDENDFVEATTDTDIDENYFVEATTDTDIDENDFVEATANTDIDETDFVEITGDTDFYDITIDGNSEDVVLVNDEELSDEIEFYDGYNSDNTLNTTSDSSGDQTDVNLPDPNYSAYSAYIDNYFRSLEFSGDVSESGKQYVKAA